MNNNTNYFLLKMGIKKKQIYQPKGDDYSNKMSTNIDTIEGSVREDLKT